MTVTITAPAGSSPASFALSNGGYETPDKFSIRTDRLVQTAQFLRGKQNKKIDRGNRHTAITFSVTRLFNTVPDAEQYILMHETTIPGTGLVTFRTLANGKFYLQNAVIQTTESHQTGKTTFHSYQIEGGILSTLLA